MNVEQMNKEQMNGNPGILPVTRHFNIPQFLVRLFNAFNIPLFLVHLFNIPLFLVRLFNIPLLPVSLLLSKSKYESNTFV